MLPRKIGKVYSLQAGFTIIEIVVVIAVFSITILSMGSMFSSLQGAQRDVQYLDIATNAAKNEIEQLRNSNFSLLTAGQTIDITSSLPSGLPPNTTGSVAISDPSLLNLKRADVTIMYSVGTYPHTVKVSSLIGASGLTQ